MRKTAMRATGLLSLAVGMVTVSAAGPALAAYTLAPGDTVELNVVGAPELRTKSTVDVDGEIRFPLVSPIQAVGRTVDEVQTEVSRQISQQAYRQRASDGHDTVIAIDPSSVSVDVTEYRPIYVRGDVSKPGEQVFRPGMTVRQVIALAGGYDIMRFRMDNPVLSSSDLRADYEQLWTDLAREQAHAALVRAQIEDKPAPDLVQTIKAPIPTSVLSDIVGNEIKRVSVEQDDFKRQLAYLQTAATNANTEMQAFVGPKVDAQKSEKDENDYADRLGQLLSKGVIARSQVIDQQRSMLASSERLLNYSSRISDLARTRADYDRQAQHLTDDHRAVLLKDLQDSTVQIAATRSKLQAVGEKLLYTGVISSQLLRGTGGKPEIKIVHADQNGQELPAGEDTRLLAGDTVDVSLRAEMLPGTFQN